MTVREARDAAWQWMLREGSGIPGFCGAYTAGSTNWLPDDATLPRTSDCDVMVVMADPNRAGRRAKISYRDTLLDVSYLAIEQFHSRELVLSDYHLAPSLRTTNVILDPSGRLTALRAVVRNDYAKRHWVRMRCAHARNKLLGCRRPIHQEAPLQDQVMPWLFAAGITTHVLLVAGLKNPTVRTRYRAARELLADYGHLEFHQAMLELLGCGQISPERVKQHLAALGDLFDAAKEVLRTPFPFASEISDSTRHIAIAGSSDLIERGYHREAMFWIAVSASRCQQVLDHDAPIETQQRFSHGYQELASDLGVLCYSEVRRRCEEVERFLPRVWEMAENIMAANRGIIDD